MEVFEINILFCVSGHPVQQVAEIMATRAAANSFSFFQFFFFFLVGKILK